MRVLIELRVDFGQPVRLSEVAAHKTALLVRGIYLLTEKEPSNLPLESCPVEIVYIGKAIRETVFSRCQKHLWSVQDKHLASGNPRTRPGRSFKLYREKIRGDSSALWIVPGVMAESAPYAISCAEEYLLHGYLQRHGRYPWCNTAGNTELPNKALH